MRMSAMGNDVQQELNPGEVIRVGMTKDGSDLTHSSSIDGPRQGRDSISTYSARVLAVRRV